MITITRTATPTATVVAALAAASGAAHACTASMPGDVSTTLLRAQASIAMRVAQVELYCDHPAAALGAIRRALQQLEHPFETTAAAELATLERAAWHVRRHDTSAAVAALDVALAHLVV